MFVGVSGKASTIIDLPILVNEALEDSWIQQENQSRALIWLLANNAILYAAF